MDAMPSEDFLLHLAAPFLRYQHTRPSSEMDRFVTFVLTRFSTAVVLSALGWCVYLDLQQSDYPLTHSQAVLAWLHRPVQAL
jgi:hypothetical protein